MIEKLIENWLDRSTERSWQRPFCAMLAARGHNVVHSTRHSEFELGVDVISLNPQNEVCAFQLKSARGERLTLNEWREISSQVDDMVCRQLKHPAIPEQCQHRSFLVVDAWLEESVSRAIDDRNEQWRNRGQPYRKIELRLRSDLLRWACDLGGSLWPSELADNQLLLEIFLSKGDGQLPIEKLCKLIEATCPISDDCRKPTVRSVQRTAAATVLLTGIAASNFAEKKNHGAEIEAWTICLASLLACCDRWRIKRSELGSEISLAEQFVFDSLSRLALEVRERETLLEGDPIFDAPFELLRVRTTFIAAMLSVFGIWRRQIGEPSGDLDDFLRDFVLSNTDRLFLWGEAAVPQFLAVFFFMEQNDASCRPDSFLLSVVRALVESNKPGAAAPIPSPYYEVNAAMPHHWRIADKSIDDSFDGGSYCLEGLLHLVTRRGWKHFLAHLWYDVSVIARYEFVLEKKWHFYRRRNLGHGTNVTTIPSRPQRWEDLLETAKECEGQCVPRQMKLNPAFFLLFLCVMPHRYSSDAIRWLDGAIQ